MFIRRQWTETKWPIPEESPRIKELRFENIWSNWGTPFCVVCGRETWLQVRKKKKKKRFFPILSSSFFFVLYLCVVPLLSFFLSDFFWVDFLNVIYYYLFIFWGWNISLYFLWFDYERVGGDLFLRDQFRKTASETHFLHSPPITNKETWPNLK